MSDSDGWLMPVSAKLRWFLLLFGSVVGLLLAGTVLWRDRGVLEVDSTTRVDADAFGWEWFGDTYSDVDVRLRIVFPNHASICREFSRIYARRGVDQRYSELIVLDAELGPMDLGEACREYVDLLKLLGSEDPGVWDWMDSVPTEWAWTKRTVAVEWHGRIVEIVILPTFALGMWRVMVSVYFDQL